MPIPQLMRYLSFLLIVTSLGCGAPIVNPISADLQAAAPTQIVTPTQAQQMPVAADPIPPALSLAEATPDPAPSAPPVPASAPPPAPAPAPAPIPPPVAPCITHFTFDGWVDMGGSPVLATVTLTDVGQWDVRLVADGALIQQLLIKTACGEIAKRSLSAMWIQNPRESWWLEARLDGVLIFQTPPKINPYN